MRKAVKLLVTGAAFNGTISGVSPYVVVDSIELLIGATSAKAVVYAGGRSYTVKFIAGTFATDVVSYADDLATRGNA